MYPIYSQVRCHDTRTFKPTQQVHEKSGAKNTSPRAVASGDYSKSKLRLLLELTLLISHDTSLILAN
ncbi:hypothetical protein BgiMline_025457, partial [Biomphalaria glabrata]